MQVHQPPTPSRRLDQAIGRLVPIEREILFLSARDNCSIAEIAARLGLTSAAVERHLAHSLQAIDRDIERAPRRWWRFW